MFDRRPAARRLDALDVAQLWPSFAGEISAEDGFYADRRREASLEHSRPPVVRSGHARTQ